MYYIQKLNMIFQQNVFYFVAEIQRYAAFKNTKSKIGTARRTELINKEREEQRAAAEAKRQADKAAKGYKYK